MCLRAAITERQQGVRKPGCEQQRRANPKALVAALNPVPIWPEGMGQLLHTYHSGPDLSPIGV